ncbi:response regulator transcription factor [Paenibacillus endoradicis]|uniref:response regulator transcription factor n=1 Tax=Paenibacillus endoradicis TaxID=2972487 RepID=UPI0021592B50|nr:helix-turn-helix domain-containing protein [Paenibacillus endoradicis]MCR8657134.1 AraC family transcriptional regulator [Paenibacillus endoradicis]
MYNVIIIDDEEPLREAIKILGAWEELGVLQLYEASNGHQALDVLNNHTVHIALVDMKMPELNGSQLLQLIEQQYPNLLSIVISGYNDFEYTRQAIRSRVVDYILKPVNRYDLNTALRNAVGIIEAKQRKAEETIHQNITLNMSLPKLKEKLYLSLIDRNFKTYYNEDLMRLVGLGRNNHLFAITTIRFLNMDALIKRRFKNDIDLLQFATSNVIHDVLSTYVQTFSFANPKQEREIITVVSLEGNYREDMNYKLYHGMNSLLTTLQNLFELDVIIGVGLPVHEITELATSFEQSKLALMSYELSKRSAQVVKYDEGIHQNLQKDHKSIFTRMAQLRQVLDTGNSQLLQSMLHDMMNQWNSTEQFTIGESDKLTDELIMVLNDIAIEYGVPASELPNSDMNAIRVLGIFGDYNSYEQYKEVLQQIITKYKQCIDAVKQQDTIFKISDIKKYIDQYYYEDIKVTMFAEKYYLSREYLMKLFKQQYGCGIHEYVQSVRMEKAKVLLEDANLKIQDISEMLGYKDKNYFSKAFRNYFEMTPSEYRACAEK